MIDPLDYHSPNARPGENNDAVTPIARPATVVPVEFDAKLTTSADHAAVVAIETALRAGRIDTFRADDGELAGREITLYVKAADLPKAADVAGRIFARRARVKSMAPPPPPKAVDEAWPDPLRITGLR